MPPKYKSKRKLKEQGLMTSKGEIVSEGTYKQSQAMKSILQGFRKAEDIVVPKHRRERKRKGQIQSRKMIDWTATQTAQGIFSRAAKNIINK